MLDDLTSASARLEALRGLLYEPSSRTHGKDICTIFEHWPDDEDPSVGLAYADDRLDLWPDDLVDRAISGWPLHPRRAPDAWARAALSGRPVPTGWPLVRFVQYHYQTIKPAFFNRVLPSNLLSRITHLYLAGTSLEAEDVLGILDAPSIGRLTHLVLYGNRLKSGVRALTRHPALDQLRHLDLGACSLVNDDIHALARAKHGRRLTTLGLSYNTQIDAASWRALLTSNRFPDLTQLYIKQHPASPLAPDIIADATPQMARAVFAADLTQQTPKDLKALCRERGLRGYSKLNKAPLIARLLEAWDDAQPS